MRINVLTAVLGLLLVAGHKPPTLGSGAMVGPLSIDAYELSGAGDTITAEAVFVNHSAWLITDLEMTCHARQGHRDYKAIALTVDATEVQPHGSVRARCEVEVPDVNEPWDVYISLRAGLSRSHD